MELTEKDGDRFWAKVDIAGPDDCWLWNAGIDRDGYGMFSVRRKPHGAHRVAVALDGRDPTGKHVLHSCENKACVNPAHLRLGNHRENMLDRRRQNRHARLSGEAHGRAKLTEAQVWDILIAIAEGEKTQSDIAREYGVHRATIRELWEKCGGGYISFSDL